MHDGKAETATPLLALWIALVAALAVGGSLAFACATPLAAIAALASLTMRRVEGVALVLTAWLANQLVGFGVLHYPLDVNTFGWGGAIGAAAVAGFLAARWAVLRDVPSLLRFGLALVVSYAVYEIGLFTYGVVVGSSGAAFTPEIVARIFFINVIAFAGLLVLRGGGVVPPAAASQCITGDDLTSSIPGTPARPPFGAKRTCHDRVGGINRARMTQRGHGSL